MDQLSTSHVDAHVIQSFRNWVHEMAQLYEEAAAAADQVLDRDSQPEPAVAPPSPTTAATALAAMSAVAARVAAHMPFPQPGSAANPIDLTPGSAANPIELDDSQPRAPPQSGTEEAPIELTEDEQEELVIEPTALPRGRLLQLRDAVEAALAKLG